MSARVTRPVLSVILVIGLLASAAAGRLYAQASTDVQIDSAAIEGNTLTITGKNFGADTPTVQVGESSAAIVRHTATEIVAETVALAPGIYSLKIVRDASAGGKAMASLLIQ